MLFSKKHSGMIKILFLAANPSGESRLALDEEFRAIDEQVQKSQYGDLFDIRQQWAVRVSDVQWHLLRHKPDIVHFCGYGNRSSEIVLQDGNKGRPVSVKALSNLFLVLKDNIQCVVLNTCYSEAQALAIAKHIDCVVGMSRAINDDSAISFASSFYQALGFGRDIKTAFDLGCQQIDLESLAGEDAPKLVALRANPRKIVLVSPAAIEAPDDPAVEVNTPQSGLMEPPAIKDFQAGVFSDRDQGNRISSRIFNSPTFYIGLTVSILISIWLVLGTFQRQGAKGFDTEGRIDDSGDALKIPAPSSEILVDSEASPFQKMLATAAKDFQEGRYDSAINTCKSVLAISPNQANALLFLGQSYYNVGSPKAFEYLVKALKQGQTVVLPVKHHHYDGVLKIDDGLCVGYIEFQTQRLEFHSRERAGHDFSITPNDIHEFRDESQRIGRLHLKISIQRGGLSFLEDYNFYSPLASLQKQMTRTKVYCQDLSCRTAMQTLYRLLQEIKS
jgi:hypothetical protein